MAIVTFKSNAAGEIYMFRETAEKVFKVIGKPLGIRGVLTPEELPAAIAALKTEMEKEKEYLKAVRERESRLCILHEARFFVNFPQNSDEFTNTGPRR